LCPAASADLHVSELARNIGWHVGAADYHTRRQSLLLIPPATPLGLAQEPQMLSIRENAHATSERSVLETLRESVRSTRNAIPVESVFSLVFAPCSFVNVRKGTKPRDPRVPNHISAENMPWIERLAAAGSYYNPRSLVF
jgi:hypothetical protein